MSSQAMAVWSIAAFLPVITIRSGHARIWLAFAAITAGLTAWFAWGMKDGSSDVLWALFLGIPYVAAVVTTRVLVGIGIAGACGYLYGVLTNRDFPTIGIIAVAAPAVALMLVQPY